MEKKTRPSSRKSCENVGIPKSTFYGWITTLVTFLIGIAINTNARLSVLENQKINDKENNLEIKRDIGIMLDKLSNIETQLVLKADKKFQN